jgi:uncharacterized protein
MRESRYNIWVERGNAAYVFNGVSGSLLRIPKEHAEDVRKFLAHGDQTTCPPKFLAYLAQGCMIIQDDADEIELLADRYQISRHDTSQFALTIVTSLGCNFDCPYCFEAKHPSIMDGDVQQTLLQVVDDQLPKISSFRVTWFGGEPLVGKQPLLLLSEAFIERCDSAGVDYSADIITNGYFLDKETCAQLRERRVQHAQVGLDGPPAIHDQMRPQANGKGSFWSIVKNLHHALDYLRVSVRVNLDSRSCGSAEDLLRILAAEGFAGKLSVYPGQIIGVNDGTPSPSTTYQPSCLTNRQFASAELKFMALARRYGFASASLPTPTGAPCTAVRANELVVGSKGELYKCWNSVGNHLEVIGNIRDYQNSNTRLQKWASSAKSVGS